MTRHAPKQSAMFTTSDLPLFSGTAQAAKDERYAPRPAAPKQSTFNMPQPSERELSNRATAEDPNETTERAECLIDELIPHAEIDPRATQMINTLHNAITANHAQAAIQPATELINILKGI